MKRLKVLFIYANCMMDNLIPVSASSILGALRAAGVETELFDTTFYNTEERPPDEERVENLQVAPFDYSSVGVSIKETDVFVDLKGHVLRFKPDVVMISMVEATYRQSIALLESIKDIRPYTVAGGVFAILSPDEVIANGCIDAACVGEGEDAALDFCEKFSDGRDFTDVAGMWFKRGAAIIKNPLKDIVNLNEAPFLDFSAYEKGRFYKPMEGRIFRMVPLEFSRGCPYRCAYCANHAIGDHYKALGRWYRWKSIDRIFAEIDEYVKRYKVEFFYFVSETFLSMPEKKFDEFCERYSDYKIPFWFNTRPETITGQAIKRLEDINCFRMGIGLEHGNEKFRRKVLNRSVSNKKIVEACRMVEESKITYSINNIIGFPGETRGLVFDTIRLNRMIRPDTVGTFIFTPYKGTELYRYCIEHDYLAPGAPVGDLNKESVLQNNPLSGKELKGLLRTFPLYVHFDEDAFPLIKKAEDFTEEGDSIFKELSARYMDEHFSRSKRKCYA